MPSFGEWDTVTLQILHQLALTPLQCVPSNATKDTHGFKKASVAATDRHTAAWQDQDSVRSKIGNK